MACNSCNNLASNYITFPDFVSNSCCNPCCSGNVAGVGSGSCGCGCGCSGVAGNSTNGCGCSNGCGCNTCGWSPCCGARD